MRLQFFSRLFFLSLFATLSTQAVFAGQNSVYLALEIKHQGPTMESLADQVTDPTSPRYGKPFSLDEINQATPVDGAAYAKLRAKLTALGLTLKRESPDHHYIFIEADAPTVEKAFSVKIVSRVMQGVFEYVSTGTPKLDGELALINHVVGLDSGATVQNAHHPKLRRDGMAPSYQGDPKRDTKTVDDYYGNTELLAKGYDGSGVKIGIFQVGQVDLDHVKTYHAQLGTAKVPNFEVIACGMYDGKTIDQGSRVENAIDLEVASRYAPGATIRSYITGALSTTAETVDAYAKMVDEVDVISTSYGTGNNEHSPSARAADLALSPIFAKAVALGKTVYSASGDDGSNYINGKPVVESPTSKNIITVGATAFKTHAQTGAILNEVAWPLSGGGISAYEPAPLYQGKVTKIKTRAMPDVSHYGSNELQPFYVLGFDASGNISQTPGWSLVSGTSLAAPAKAGFMAKVIAARKALGKPALPFMGPVYYDLYADAAACADVFRDIVEGNNINPPGPGRSDYSSTTGFDQVTGIGTMKGGVELFNKLIAL